MTKTIVGLFDEYREAQRAVVALVENGVSREDIGITSQEYTNYEGSDSYRGDASRGDEGVGDKISNFFSRLFGDDDEYASHYTEAVGRGGTVVTVDCESDEMADRAEAILNRFGGDVDEHGESHRQAAYMGTDSVETNRTELAEDGEARIPVIEEEMRVGKRE